MSLTSLWTNETVDVASLGLQPNTPVTVLSSTSISNTGGGYQNSLKLSLRYSAINPGLNFQTSWWLGAVVEHEVDPASGRWQTIMSQFTPIRHAGQALERRLEIQPNFDSFNLGIDEIIAPIDDEVARVSREPGALPDGNIRVCIIAREDNAGNANALTSFVIDGDLELFSV